MPETRESLESLQSEIHDRGKIDPCEMVGAIMVICDALGDFALDEMKKVKSAWEGKMRLGEGGTARILLDLIEISQSNPPRAISDIIEILEIQDRIDELED